MESNLSLLYDSLFSLLESELAVYREMEGLLQKEKEALVHSSLPVLLQSNRMKEDMTNRAALLERSRNDLVRQIAGYLRVSPETINLSYLMTYLHLPQQERLRRFQEELRERALRIKSLNRENQELAEASLFYARSWFDYFRRLLTPQHNYVSNGQMQPVFLNGKLIDKRG
ncbi:MAG: flagellar protein FlgN [Pseudomonadota bacterium]|nr:flagellar protein FlgN [Pseudomonadota bacterium]